jgi:hypothetical protein
LFHAAVVWGCMLICGRIFSQALSKSRSRSLQFRNAPAWVRWSLLSYKSTSAAILGSIINIIFGAGLIGLMVTLRLSRYAIAITNLSVLVDQRIVVLTAFILLVAALLPIILGIAGLFSVRWVQRRGGWTAQLLRKLPL